MAHLLPSTIFGQLVRQLSGNKLFRYPDELDPCLWERLRQRDSSTPAEDVERSGSTNEKAPATETPHSKQNGVAEIILVDWYGSDDPENPQNWPAKYKHFIAFQLCVLNFAVYIASSIYVPGEPAFMAEFGVSETVATLGLSLFTVGYGLGPMLWSPLSEHPRLGRTAIFFWTLFAFLLLQLPVGLAPNPAVFLVFRAVTGFFGSPCLSTGGGAIVDIYPPHQVPYLLCIWSWAGVLGPIFGPLVGGYLAPALGWRWTIWVYTCLGGVVLMGMFFTWPETSAANILYRRAQRLRRATGNLGLKSQTEIDAAHHTTRDTLLLLARAFTLTFGEPVVLLMDLYAGLLYGILFIWFESFPIVFGGIYHFSAGEQGLVFLSILVFTLIAAPFFLLWMRNRLVPAMLSGSFQPEMFLPPAFIGCFALPVCLFWFGWTAREDVHWMVPVVGSGMFAIGVVTLFNSVYMYIGHVYARNAASIFAGAALFRAALGASFPLFARALFVRLGVGPGNSLLGALAVLFIPTPFIFYHYGPRIRQWSKNAD